MAVSDYAGLIYAAAARYPNVPIPIISGVMQQETGGKNIPGAAGEIGLMQIMPGTARGLGVSNPSDLWTPALNVDTGTRLLSQLAGQYSDWTQVLSVYNTGNPNSARGQAYAASVLANASRFGTVEPLAASSQAGTPVVNASAGAPGAAGAAGPAGPAGAGVARPSIFYIVAIALIVILVGVGVVGLAHQ